MPHMHVVFYLSDEMITIREPIGVTFDAPGTSSLKIQLIVPCSAKT